MCDLPVFTGKSPVDILRKEQERVRLVAAAFINTVSKKTLVKIIARGTSGNFCDVAYFSVSFSLTRQ